jgi:hypothetical protein
MRQIAVLLLVFGTAACSSVKLPDLSMPTEKPSAAAVERYGVYCEQVGNLRGSPEFERCVRKQEDTYR